MANLSNQSFLIILIAAVAVIVLAAVLFFVVSYLRSAGKEKEGTLYLKISKEFEQQMEGLMAKQLRESVMGLNKKIQLFNEEIIESYKREIASFFRGAEGEFSKISNFNKSVQDELKQEVEKKIAEFDAGFAQARGMLFQEARERTAELGKDLSGQASRAYRSAAESLKERDAEIKKEIENYKKEKMEELDKEIYRIIGEVAKNTIGKTIDLSSHEDLVMDALEKARREQVL